MGSLFLPNLPWLNPAALVLGLPLERPLIQMLSYTLYFCELAASTVLLLRANLAQTLLLFEGEIEVRVAFRFGPGSSAACRLQDTRDMARLKLR